MEEKNLGVALTACYFCGKSGNTLIINSILTPQEARKVEELNGKVINMEPCSECHGYMEKGIMLIEIDNEKSEPNWFHPKGRENFIPDPYRTGRFVVLKEEAFNRWITADEKSKEFGNKRRFLFVEKGCLSEEFFKKQVNTEA